MGLPGNSPAGHGASAERGAAAGASAGLGAAGRCPPCALVPRTGSSAAPSWPSSPSPGPTAEGVPSQHGSRHVAASPACHRHNEVPAPDPGTREGGDASGHPFPTS